MTTRIAEVRDIVGLNGATGAPFMTTTSLPPEMEILLCCARTHLDAKHTERLRDLLQQDINWAYLLCLAHQQRITPLLFRHLNATGPEAVPKVTLEQLRSCFQANSQQNKFLAGAMVQLLTSGVLAMPFQNPILTYAVAGNLSLWQFDIQAILIHRQDFQQAKAILGAHGYLPKADLRGGQEAALLQFQHSLSFVNADETRYVVLHWEYALRQFTEPAIPAHVPHGPQRIMLDGTSIQGLAAEHWLLLHCAHGFAHRGGWLEWIADIAELMRAYPRMDWRWLMQRAAALGCRRMLSLGLFLASELLDTSPPQEVLGQVQSDPAVHSLAIVVYQYFLRGGEPASGAWSKHLFPFQVRERIRDKIRYGLSRTMSPTVEDVAFLPLPASLARLYYLLRPMRLGIKYGSRMLRKSKSLAAFEPSPPGVVERMLVLAEVGSTDVVYDLGCGDGRFVSMAATKYGARGVGIDIDSQRIAEANARARQEGVEHLVTFVQQDLMTVDISPATVVTLFLERSVNLKLRPILQEHLQPGTRIVSYWHDMGNWAPAKTEFVAHAGGVAPIYLWCIQKTTNSTLRTDDSAQSQNNINRNGERRERT